MAQIHKLKDRETGKTLYPETVCGAITDFDSRMEAERQKTDDALSKKVGAVAGKGLSTNDYTNDDKAKLGALPTKDELDTALTAAVDKAVDEALIAEATAAGAVYNRATGYFELNTLTDITAAQMRTILAAGARQSSTLSAAYISSPIRTHLPRVGMGQAAYAADTFRSCTLLEDVEMPNLKLQGDVFFDCKRLRSVNWKSVQIYDLNNTARANFQGCSKLVELRGTLRSNFDFNIADSPLLSLASLQHLVNNAINTSAITVTVHPDVYAKLTDESNAEWHTVLTDAEAKQITFATTN